MYIIPRIPQLFIISCAIFFHLVSCHKVSESNVAQETDVEATSSIQLFDEAEVVKYVKESVDKTLQKLTQVNNSPNVYLGKIIYGKSKEIIAEFTVNFDKLEFQVLRLPQSKYDQENDVKKFDIKIVGGLSVRAKPNSAYPYLHPWSDPESVADTLEWKWMLKNSPDEGTQLKEHRKGELELLAADEASTVYQPEPRNERVASNVYESFEKELKRYFHTQDIKGKSAKVITWLTNLPGYAEGIYMIHQACGNDHIFAKTFDVDKEGLNNGVKQRGFLSYIIGPNVRTAKRGDDKWSKWNENCTVTRCYYQIDQNDQIQWVDGVGDSGEIITTKEQTEAWIYGAGAKQSNHNNLVDLHSNMTGWLKLLANDNPRFSINHTYLLPFLEKECQSFSGVCEHANCAWKQKRFEQHTIDSLAKYLSANSHTKGYPMFLPMKIAQILDSVEALVEYMPESALSEGMGDDKDKPTSKGLDAVSGSRKVEKIAMADHLVTKVEVNEFPSKGDGKNKPTSKALDAVPVPDKVEKIAMADHLVTKVEVEEFPNKVAPTKTDSQQKKERAKIMDSGVIQRTKWNGLSLSGKWKGQVNGLPLEFVWNSADAGMLGFSQNNTKTTLETSVYLEGNQIIFDCHRVLKSAIQGVGPARYIGVLKNGRSIEGTWYRTDQDNKSQHDRFSFTIFE